MTRSIKSMLIVVGATFAFALEPEPVAQAEVTLDVSKLTCEQFLGYKLATSEKIATWLMTSFAFILGLLPLVVTVGASQLARRNVGTPIFGGMILASLVGIFAIPPLYVTFQAIREKLRPSARPKERPEKIQPDSTVEFSRYGRRPRQNERAAEDF
jgi:hypothetical protein